MCTRKKPTPTQTLFSETLHSSQEKAKQKVQKKKQSLISGLLSFLSSVSFFPSIVCCTKARHSFWMTSAPRGMGDEEGEERVRQAAVASSGARHNFISTSWAIKKIWLHPPPAWQLQKSEVWKPALQIHLSIFCSHQCCTFPLAASTHVGIHLQGFSWGLLAQRQTQFWQWCFWWVNLLDVCVCLVEWSFKFTNAIVPVPYCAHRLLKSISFLDSFLFSS